MAFSSLGLSGSLVRAVERFEEATPVQREAIPEVLAGRDVLVTARTGSGKTTAFVLPILDAWLKEKRVKPRRVLALILVPTRELAAQVREVVQEYAGELPERVKVMSAVGGVSINPQMMALRGGADLVVATPGRLLDLVEKNAVDLSEVGILVLDEADRMLDSGFANEVGRILELLPERRQNLLFSATFPTALEELAGGILREARRIEIVDEPEEEGDILQRVIRVDEAKRTPLLRYLIAEEGWDRVLVFVGRKYTADHVAEKLNRNGIEALSLHGDLSQGARTEVVRSLKSGDVQVVVATDLAARGLDIAGLPAVVNYELPRSAADYVHRIGRTGRAGEQGVAVSLVTAQAVAHFSLIEKRNGLSLVREVVKGFEPVDEVPAVAKGTGWGERASEK